MSVVVCDVPRHHPTKAHTKKQLHTKQPTNLAHSFLVHSSLPAVARDMLVGKQKETVKIVLGSEGRSGPGSLEQVGLREGPMEEISGRPLRP